MKVCAVVPSTRANPVYRAIWPINALAARGHEVASAVVPDDQPLPPLEELRQFDVVYIWQRASPEVRRMTRALQQSGVAVTWDIDDDVTATPRAAANYRLVGGIKGQQRWAEITRMVALVDAVTTPSPVLAARFGQLGQAHVHLIENYLEGVAPAERSRPWRRRSRGAEVVIGWVAALEHEPDVTALGLRAAFTRLLEERPEVRVETVCLALGIEHARYRRIEPMPLGDLPACIAGFDVGIAPLADNPFNRARSNVELKEYAAAGIPWLASPIGPYAGMGEEQGGRLVEDDRWYEQLLALVTDEKVRRRLGDRARQWAETQTLAANIGQWERILEGAIERAQARSAQRMRA